MEKALIGSQEWCSFENLNIPSIKARIDSGAKTSSIHLPILKNSRKAKSLGCRLMSIQYKTI